VGDREAVWCILVHLQFSVLDHLGSHLAGGFERHDLVAVTVDDQGRYVDFGHVRAKVGFRERSNAIHGGLERGEQGDLQGLGQYAVGDFLALVDAEERRVEVGNELRAVLQQAGLDINPMFLETNR